MKQRAQIRPWLLTAALAGIPSLFFLWLASRPGWDSVPIAIGLTAFFTLPLALIVCWIWVTQRHLPPPSKPYEPDPLYLPGSFALSTVQFFPVHEEYREDPPAPPKKPHTRSANVAAAIGLVFAVAACIVPIYGAGSAMVALACCLPVRKKETCRRRALAGIVFAAASLLQNLLVFIMILVWA